jgi:hypothetical protein
VDYSSNVATGLQGVLPFFRLFDPLACPTCHGPMRVVAFITQASVIDQILAHLRTRAAREAHAGPRSPPSTRASARRGQSRAPRPSAEAPTTP